MEMSSPYDNNLTQYSTFQRPFTTKPKTAGIRQNERNFDISAARKKCCWFQYWTISWNVYGAGLFCIPYRVSFDKTTQLFSIRASSIQKTIWIIMQMSGVLIMRVRILDGWNYLKNSDEKLRYFDFGFLIVVYCFDTTFKLILWGKRNKLQVLMEEIQNSPLLQISSQSSLTISVFCHVFCISYLIPSFFYFCLTWGIDSIDVSQFYEAVKNQAFATFNLQDENWEKSPYFSIILILSFVFNQYQASFWHFNDTYVLSSIFMMNKIAKDVNSALKTQFTDAEGLILINAYRSLIHKFNDALGLAVNVYSLYCSPYYAIHLVDMLSLPDFMNRFSMSVYLGFLTIALAACVQMNNMAWEIKRWLNTDQKYKKIKLQSVQLYLHDLNEKNFGLGTFFKISNTLTGQVVNLILTLAIITVQMRMLSVSSLPE